MSYSKRNVAEGIATAVVIVLSTILYVVGGIIHLVTAILGGVHIGAVAGIIMFFAPVIAEIFWFITCWRYTSAFINPYSVPILIYAGLWAVRGLLALYIARGDECGR